MCVIDSDGQGRSVADGEQKNKQTTEEDRRGSVKPCTVWYRPNRKPGICAGKLENQKPAQFAVLCEVETIVFWVFFLPFAVYSCEGACSWILSCRW